MEYNTHYRNETSYEQESVANTMAPLDLIPYQIDYSSKNVGKTVANTKKKIEFKFGFANNDAISHGQKGVACRGVEHKVVLKWSLTSGKTVVECDMKEIHFGLSGSKFQFSWPLRKSVVIEVVAHAAPCSTKGNAPANWKQFDLFINGVSYFHFPKIFELGIVPFRGLQAHPSPYGRNSPRSMMGGQGYGGGNFGRPSYNAPPPGDFAAAQAPRDQTPPSPPQEADLLDFGAPEPVPAPVQQPQAQPQQLMYGAAPAPEFAMAPAAPAATQALPVAAVPSAYEQQPPAFAASPAQVSHCAEPAVPAFAAAPVAPPAPQFEVAQAPPVETVPAPAPAEPVHTLPPAQTNERRDPSSTMSGVERAMDNLVNLSDITASPDLQVGKLTMMSSDVKQNASKSAFNNAVPLSELKSTAEPKKSVMNTFTPNPSMQQQQPGMYGAQQYGMPQQQPPQPGMYGQNPMSMGSYQQQQPPMAPQQVPYSNYQL